jgi:NAD(P)-dependent dehydrogenase (short-subunit alcohol dehydrogenase family)
LSQNNAAIFLDPHADQYTTRALLEKTYNTNVFGAANMITAFLPLLERSAFPRIINMSSSLGSLTAMSDPNDPFFIAQCLVALPCSFSDSAILTSDFCRHTTQAKLH